MGYILDPYSINNSGQGQGFDWECQHSQVSCYIAALFKQYGSSNECGVVLYFKVVFYKKVSV